MIKVLSTLYALKKYLYAFVLTGSCFVLAYTLGYFIPTRFFIFMFPALFLLSRTLYWEWRTLWI